MADPVGLTPGAARADQETHRHRCEVRQLLRWRVEHGREWLRQWLAGVERVRGKGTLQRLEADIRQQWERGNRGARDDWR